MKSFDLWDIFGLLGGACFCYTIPLIFELLFLAYHFLAFVLFGDVIPQSSTMKMSIILAIMGISSAFCILICIGLFKPNNDVNTCNCSTRDD